MSEELNSDDYDYSPIQDLLDTQFSGDMNAMHAAYVNGKLRFEDNKQLVPFLVMLGNFFEEQYKDFAEERGILRENITVPKVDSKTAGFLRNLGFLVEDQDIIES